MMESNHDNEDNVEDIAQIKDNKSGKTKIVRKEAQNQKEKRIIKKGEKKKRKHAYFREINGPYLFLKLFKSAKMWSFKSKIEGRLTKILKLLKNNGEDNKGKTHDDSMEKSQIIKLVHELQNEYNKLYSQYDHLKGEIGKKVQSKREIENSSSLPTSDSEYYSSDELENGNDEFDPELEFKTPREFQTPRNLKTPRKDNRSKRNGRKRDDPLLVKVSEESEASSQIKELEEQLNVLKMDLELVSKEKYDLQVRVEEKENEARQFNDMNLQLSSQISELHVMLEAKGNDMDLELVRKQKDDLQVQFEEKEMENLQLNSRISELQTLLEEKRNEISDLTRKMEGNEKDLNWKIESLTKQLNKEYAMVKALKDEAKTMLSEIARRTNSERGLLKEKEGLLLQIEDLKLEVNSLHDQKNEVEEMIRGKEQDKAKKVQGLDSKCDEEEENETSTQIIALKEQVNNLQHELDSAQSERQKWKTNSAQNLMELENEEHNKNLKDKDDIKLLKTHSLDIQKLQVAESPRNSTRVLNHHTLERKIVEHADKFQMKVENQMRLLAQRIRVAEQIQTESKESYKKILESLEQENKELNGKNLFYEAEAKKIKEVFSESGNFMLSEMDSVVKRINEEHGKFLSKVSSISNEIQFARNWVTGKNDEISNLKENLEVFTCKPDGIEKINTVQVLKRKLEDLEGKLREKDEILSIVGEGKREAIRQLCYQIDYHRHRYDELKETVSKMAIKFNKQDD